MRGAGWRGVCALDDLPGGYLLAWGRTPYDGRDGPGIWQRGQDQSTRISPGEGEEVSGKSMPCWPCSLTSNAGNVAIPCAAVWTNSFNGKQGSEEEAEAQLKKMAGHGR